MAIDPNRSHQLRNTLQTVLLLGGMITLLMLLGDLLFGLKGMVLMLAAGILIALLTPRASAWLTLHLYQARPISYESAPGLYELVEILALRAGLPQPPLLFHIPSAEANAFTLKEHGRALIAMTDGLLHELDRDELAGVLAHEISHIRNNDLGVMMAADLLSRITAAFSLTGQIMLIISLPLLLLTDTSPPWMAIALFLLTPGIAILLQLGLSRTREFNADLDAARLTGDPMSLARALAKIGRSHEGWLQRILIPGRRGDGPSLLRTHPSTSERIRRLRELAGSDQAEVPVDFGSISIEPGFRVVLTPRRWHGFGVWY